MALFEGLFWSDEFDAERAFIYALFDSLDFKVETMRHLIFLSDIRIQAGGNEVEFVTREWKPRSRQLFFLRLANELSISKECIQKMVSIDRENQSMKINLNPGNKFMIQFIGLHFLDAVERMEKLVDGMKLGE